MQRQGFEDNFWIFLQYAEDMWSEKYLEYELETVKYLREHLLLIWRETKMNIGIKQGHEMHPDHWIWGSIDLGFSQGVFSLLSCKSLLYLQWEGQGTLLEPPSSGSGRNCYTWEYPTITHLKFPCT